MAKPPTLNPALILRRSMSNWLRLQAGAVWLSDRPVGGELLGHLWVWHLVIGY
jgi:hypothetical protein